MGTLWFEGVNYASDALIIVEINDVKHMVAIKRRSGHWAMPGGFRERSHVDGDNPAEDDVEDARHAAFRELLEETGFATTPRARAAAELVYEGRVTDPRNAHDRWIETAVFFLDLGRMNPPPTLVASNEGEVCYLPLTEENVLGLFPGHAEIVSRILDERGWTTCDDCIRRMFAHFMIDDYPERDQPISPMTHVINVIMRHVMKPDHEHAHPNYLVRLLMILDAAHEVVELMRRRTSAQLSADDCMLATRWLEKFKQETRLVEDTTTIDQALSVLPQLYGNEPEILVIIPGNGEMN